MTIGSTTNKAQGIPVASTATGPAAAPANTRSSGDAAAVASTEASAQVALSSTAASLRSGSTSAAEFDSAKVERISQAIDKGNFKIDADAIADKLIANAAELLKKSTPES